MTKLIRIMLVAALALGGLAGARVATAQDAESESDATVEQNGTSASGDAVAGQVVGIVSSGDASVDARNVSEDVDVETGDTDSTNFATVTAYASSWASFGGADADSETTVDLGQTADAASGDGVGGQVIGVVTSAGGSADVVADNTSRDVDVETGDATAENAAVVGATAISTAQSAGSGGDASSSTEVTLGQTADAASGDGVGGQVLGVVSAGDASIDAKNLSEDVDVETGDADATNVATVTAYASTWASGGDANADATADVAQTATAASGDAVAGQVAGVVTSAGGSADAVLDNTSRDSDSESGDSDFFNELNLGVTAIATASQP